MNKFENFGPSLKKTSKKPVFKMRQPPTTLTKEMKCVFVDLPKDGTALGDICEALYVQISNSFTDKSYSSLTKKHIEDNIDKIEISEHKTGRRYYAVRKIRAGFKFPESDSDFSKRIKQFENEIADYNSWRKENAKKIAQIEGKKKAKEQEKINKKQAFLSRQLLQLQAKMSKLKAAEA